MKNFYSLLLIIALLFSLASCSNSELEQEAKWCIKQTKKIAQVETINGYACFNKEYYGRDEKTLGILVLYETEYSSYYAYFENRTYKGNGNNGGDAISDEDKTFYNLHSLTAAKELAEYISENNPTLAPVEEYTDNDEGLIYLKLDNIDSWLENQ